VTAESENGADAPVISVAIRHRHTHEVLYRVTGRTLRGADLSSLALYKADLEGADLSGANLSGTSLLGADLHGARLDEANLHRATLYAADLSGASLEGADLRSTDLRGAVLEGARLHGALFAGARYGADTRWPEGFNPRSYGAFAVAPRQRAKLRPQAPAPVFSGEVLIVEDEEGIRTTLAGALQRRGFRVVTTANGREALEHLRTSSPPAVILLDMAMPEMDGWAFRIEQLKDRQLARIPVVVCSAFYEPMPAAKLARAHGYLVKPYDFDLVETTLRRFCSPEEAG